MILTPFPREEIGWSGSYSRTRTKPSRTSQEPSLVQINSIGALA